LTELWAILLTLFSSLIGSLGPIYVKKGTDILNLKTIHRNHYLIFGVLIYGISLFLFMIAMRGGEISVLYPIVSTSYIWIAFLSKRKLNEKMNTYKWAGIFLIIVGVTLLAITS